MTTMLAHAGAAILDAPAALPFAILPAGAAHLPAITAIYRAQILAGTGTWEDPLPDVPAFARRLEAVRAAGLPACVAADPRGTVLGFAWARPFRAATAYRETVEDSVHVAPTARRQGLGRALLGAVIEGCSRIGCRQMIAVVGDARNLASIGLHESLGFVAAGYLPAAGMRPEGPVEVVLLQRALAGSAAPAAGRAC